MLKLTPKLLLEIFKNHDLSDIQVVFLNACHSQHIANAFIELGVQCVIVVKDVLKINDKFAKKFSEKFYNEILDVNTIEEAFINAKNLMLRNNYYD